MPIIPFVNLKGGVAKTTNAVAVAECLASRGCQVLVIDADHQCTAGELLLGEIRLDQAERRRRTLHDLLGLMLDDEFHDRQFENFVVRDASDTDQVRPRLSVLPGSYRIDEFQTNMAKARRGFRTGEEFQAAWRRRRRALRDWLGRRFDFTIVDCPPSLTPHVRFLLLASDAFITPSVPDRLSVRGTLRLMERVDQLRQGSRPLGTLWCLYRQQVAKHRTVVADARQGAGPLARLPRPFQTIVPNAAAITNAAEPGRRYRSFSDKYTPAFARVFSNLCDEVVVRIQAVPRRV